MNVLNLELQIYFFRSALVKENLFFTRLFLPLFIPKFLMSTFNSLQLEVHEAKPVPENHPQWDTAVEGDEDQEDSEGFEDSFEEEEEEEEDDD